MVIFALASVLVSSTEVISLSEVRVLCTASKMKSVGILVFVLGLLCYVRSGKF
jgi:hypothetical protein